MSALDDSDLLTPANCASQPVTHTCPCCGAWFHADQLGPGFWKIRALPAADSTFAAGTWVHVICTPLCPDCQVTMTEFLIEE